MPKRTPTKTRTAAPSKTKKRKAPKKETAAPVAANAVLTKTPTGIAGFDAITGGGLPAGRPTLLCGGPGCGKTIFGMEFLVRGVLDHGEGGVFIAFEESKEDLAKNVASLGYDLARLEGERKLVVDFIHLDPTEVEETGAYTLDGLFVRIDLAIRSVNAKRVVIDTPEILFGGLKDTATLRAELQRLFRGLKERGLTVIITAERGEGRLTKHGIEEYVSDCVVLLDQKVDGLITTRRLRVVKYRGSSHGVDEYPFLIDEDGVSVLPMTSVQLDYEVSDDRVSTGVPDLDEMMGGEGYFRSSTILVSGAAGTGKSSLAASAAAAACARGERAMIFALEESPSQICRNMHSVGLDLARWQKEGLLAIHATRPSLYGLEMHLLTMQKLVAEFRPRLVVLDPISSLVGAGSTRDVKSMMVRLFDSLKMAQVTGIMTYLTSPFRTEETEAGVSSLVDTWLEVRDVETNGERTRGLYVIKSRGMPHSNQVREFVLHDRGIRLLDVYPGPNGIVTGSARALHDAKIAADQREREAAAARSEGVLARREAALRAQIAALEAEFASEVEQSRLAVSQDQSRAERDRSETLASAKRRSRSGVPSWPVQSEKSGKNR